MSKRARRALLPILSALSGCYFGPTDYPRVPNPPFSPQKGIVVLFNGLTLARADITSGMDMATQELHGRGITALIAAPQDWDSTARQLLALSGIREASIAVVGYSMGSTAVAPFSAALRSAGIPVQTAVVIEGWWSTEIPCNVREAVDVYFSWIGTAATDLVPAPGFTGRMKRIDVAELPGHRWDNHWSVSWSQDVHQLVEEELLEDGRVRQRPAPPGEAGCLETSGAR
jgi:hypothetical protein